MSENEYNTTEITDAEIDAQADAGLFCIEESGLEYMPTKGERDQLVREGTAEIWVKGLKKFNSGI